MKTAETRKRITVYDTTLRDGMQQEGLSLTVEDKISILRLLDRLGVAFVEGGWPGSNPKDGVFFERAAEIDLNHARLVAFGATRRCDRVVEDDGNLRALLAARTPVVTVFGKSWRLHVERVLGTSLEENLRMIGDTVAYLRTANRVVVYDAEHFFDGYRADSGYALQTLERAVEAGADVVVLCDTNGGSVPWEVAAAVREARKRVAVPVGIHAHNDVGLAVANSLAAIHEGAAHVQGTINGYGERCGNADLCTLIPILVFKLGLSCIDEERIVELAPMAEKVSEIANRQLDPQRPYVGRSAFAHKGGVHVDALTKAPESYQHIDPKRVGNRQRIVVSELGGKASIAQKALEFGLSLPGRSPETRAVLGQIKALEERGFQFEAAEASIELLMRRTDPQYRSPFSLQDFHVLVRGLPDGGMISEAAVKVEVGGEVMHTAADGNGPVNALDRAVRKALVPIYPPLGDIRLIDYKVRILDGDAGTAARIRVLITSSNGRRAWSTVGCGTNVIEASWTALADALEYALLVAQHPEPEMVGRKERQ